MAIPPPGVVLASGTHASAQYGSFGISNVRQWVHPGRLLGAVIGEFNTGKTTFLASNPAALIVNLDRSSTPYATKDSPPCAAQFWPSMGQDGCCYDETGTRIQLDHEALVKLTDRLVDAATKNLPRPETIVIDSMTEWINMLRTATLKKFGKATWDEGRGDAMWEYLYNEILTVYNRLRDAGYGVYTIIHIAPEYITEDDGKKKTRWAMTTPPGFFKRFYGRYELALEVQKSVVREVKTQQVPFDVAGTTHYRTESIVVDKTVFTLVGDNPERASMYKRRVPFPARIALTSETPWQDFVKSYMEYAKPPTA
jgi:hypothetical protein